MATQIGSATDQGSVPAGITAVERASPGIFGGKAYALFGVDLAEGDAEYVAVRRRPGEALHDAQRRAAHQALEKLEARLGCQLIYFWTPHAPVPASTRS